MRSVQGKFESNNKCQVGASHSHVIKFRVSAAFSEAEEGCRAYRTGQGSLVAQLWVLVLLRLGRIMGSLFAESFIAQQMK